MTNPTVEELRSTIYNAVADYVSVYFSGHGFTRAGNHRMICLSDGDVRDTDLLNESPRQLVIVDACRTHEQPGKISGIRWPEEKWDAATGYTAARAYFDNCISDSPFGKMIVHATGDNAYAFENRKRKGGEFTLALLDAMYSLQQTNQFGSISKQNVVSQATTLLENRSVEQIPCIYLTGHLNVPFGIISPEFIQAPELRKKPAIGTNNAQATLILACLGIFLLVAMIEN